MENDFVYDIHDNIKLRQHCNYDGIHLNTLGSKILADNFVLPLNALTWHRISQENDILDKDNPETESNSKFSNNLSQDTLESKGKSHRNFENPSFSFLKKTKSKYPKNLFFAHLNINSVRNKFESIQQIIQNTFAFSSAVKLKLIPPSQVNNLLSRSTEFSERIVMHMGEDYFFMLIMI